jgi:hypothetical protein
MSWKRKRRLKTGNDFSASLIARSLLISSCFRSNPRPLMPTSQLVLEVNMTSACRHLLMYLATRANYISDGSWRSGSGRSYSVTHNTLIPYIFQNLFNAAESLISSPGQDIHHISYPIQRFIAVSTIPRHWTISRASWIQVVTSLTFNSLRLHNEFILSPFMASDTTLNSAVVMPTLITHPSSGTRSSPGVWSLSLSISQHI